MNLQAHLMIGLQQFGLNPSDWRLGDAAQELLSKNDILVIQAKQDPEISLEGKIKYENGSFCWDYISVCGF